MKITFIPDWKYAWKYFSTQAMLWTTAILGAWTAMPDDLKDRIPSNMVFYIAIGVQVLGAIGRYVVQVRLHDDEKEQADHVS